METRSEDNVHKLRLKLSDTQLSNENRNNGFYDDEKYAIKNTSSNYLEVLNNNNNITNSIDDLNNFLNHDTTESQLLKSTSKLWNDNNNNNNNIDDEMYSQQFYTGSTPALNQLNQRLSSTTRQNNIMNNGPYNLYNNNMNSNINNNNNYSLTDINQAYSQYVPPSARMPNKVQSSHSQFRVRSYHVLPPLSADNFYNNSGTIDNRNNFVNNNITNNPNDVLSSNINLMTNNNNNIGELGYYRNYGSNPNVNAIDGNNPNYAIDPFPGRRVLMSRLNLDRSSSLGNNNNQLKINDNRSTNSRMYAPNYLETIEEPKSYNAVVNETIQGTNMDEIIDVMAKRRIALKRLEDEINTQQRRTNILLRDSALPSAQGYSLSRAGSKAASNYNDNMDTRLGSRMALTQPSFLENSLPYNSSISIRSPTKMPLPPVRKSTSTIFDADKNKENLDLQYKTLIQLSNEKDATIVNSDNNGMRTPFQTTIIHHHHYYNAPPTSNAENDNPREPSPLQLTRRAPSTIIPQKSVDKSTLPLKVPGHYKKLFWSSGIIVHFLMRIKRRAKLRNRQLETSSATIFKIRLLETMTALHRVYLEPAGPIYSALMQVIRCPYDLTALFDPTELNYRMSIETICRGVEEITQRITEFMPKEGILGTNKKSALLSIITEGNKFPDNYFWDCEKDHLEFDAKEKTRNINKQRAILLLMSACISRGLITTLLVKPIKFRLMRGEITPTQRNNIKMLATFMCYISRGVSNGNGRRLRFPLEWQESLFNDSKMDSIYKNNEVAMCIMKCENIFTAWMNEYVSRLDALVEIRR